MEKVKKSYLALEREGRCVTAGRENQSRQWSRKQLLQNKAAR